MKDKVKEILKNRVLPDIEDLFTKMAKDFTPNGCGLTKKERVEIIGILTAMLLKACDVVDKVYPEGVDK